MAAWANGDSLGPYVLVSPIGEGGMGEVWKARDTRLDRIVAVKRLKDQQGARFEQEARAIAALNHPHICQIFDIGPDYLVLEYIEGQPLNGPLSAEEAVRLACQIAEALEAAHRKGVVHRDLKPANILVTPDGSVKLLDFGLAKQKRLGESVGSLSTMTLGATEPGTIVGTVAYMSPEQAQGQPVDARSDIFSFGLVLYELLSGRRAFAGETHIATMMAIVQQDAPPLRAPAPLEGIVRRCLEKQPAQRFQSIAEIREALQKTQTGESAPQQPSIAVLPFANMSGDKDNEYFSDGLAEEILNALTQLPGLRVIARTSAFAFKGQNTDIRRIADSLGVGNVLEGSVRKSGNRIRVTAQLVMASSGSRLWSERYDRELADVFAIQDEIAQAIASALKVALVPAPARHTPEIAAYEAYLKGRYQLAQRTRTPESLARCKEFLEQAIALDPLFALPHSEFGRYYQNLTFAGLFPARESLSLAREAALRALALDPSLPQGHAVLGMVAAFLDYDWTEAERRFRLALAHDPVPPEVRSEYGMFFLLPLGRLREAVAEGERALREDPLNALGRTMLAVCLAQEPEASENQYRQILELDENFVPALFGLGLNLATRGMLAEALETAEKAHSLAPWNLQVIGVLAGVLGGMHETRRVESLLARLRPGLAYGMPRALSVFHLLRSEIDQGADWMAKAIEQRDPFFAVLIRHPLFDSLRSSPRWPALAELMNLPFTLRP